MKTHIVRSGRSHSLQIPKSLLQQTGLEGEVEISADQRQIIVGPAAKPRAGWNAAFAEMARQSDDHLLDDDVPLPRASSHDLLRVLQEMFKP
jgi:antitoxin MazE